MTERLRFFMYVPHYARVAFEEAGWRFCVDLGPPHNVYSILMEWPGADEPRMPPQYARDMEAAG